MIKFKYLLFFVFILNILRSYAAIDYLDKTFGANANGIVTSIINSASRVNGIALDSNGNILAVGNTIINYITNILVARYTPAGELDNSFGSNGGVITYSEESQSNNEVAISGNAVAVDTNNKVIVAGNDPNRNVLLLRYTSAGIPDNTFGTGGVVTLTIGDGATTTAIIIDANDKIVVTGNVAVNGFINIFIARFNADGSIDTDFGINNSGYNTIIANTYVQGTSVAIDLNSKLIVAGSVSTLNGSDFLVARFDINGQLDTTFNLTGIVTTNILGNNASMAQTVAIDSSNRIDASGYTTVNSSDNNILCIVRYNNDGSLDTTFGPNLTGIVTNNAGTNSQIFASLIDANQNIVIGGNSNNKFAIARYTSNGLLDTTFGQQGILLTTINSGAQINALALQSDGKIVAGGFEIESMIQVPQFALARYNKNNTNYINITSIANNAEIITKAPIISGTSSAANASVQIYIDDVLQATVPTNGLGNWTLTSDALTIGSHTLLVNLIVDSEVIVSEKINFSITNNIGEDTIFAYSTDTQTTTTVNTFQTITFNNIQGNNPNIWRAPNNTTLEYIAPDSGKFFYTYTVEAGILNSPADGSINVSVLILKNGIELPGSQFNTQINVLQDANGIQAIVNSGIITLVQNDTIQLQYSKDIAATAGIIANQGNGTVKPSITFNIIRLQ